MKINAFTANDVLQSANGLEAAASAKDKQLRLAIDKFCVTFLKDSDIGLVAVGKEAEFDGEMMMKKESNTTQLQQVCKDGASELKTILSRHAGEGGLGDAPRGEAKPRGGGGNLPF